MSRCGCGAAYLAHSDPVMSRPSQAVSPLNKSHRLPSTLHTLQPRWATALGPLCKNLPSGLHLISALKSLKPTTTLPDARGLPLSRRPHHALQSEARPLHTSTPSPGSPSPPVSRHSSWTSLQLTQTYGTLTPSSRWAARNILRRTSMAVFASAIFLCFHAC